MEIDQSARRREKMIKITVKSLYLHTNAISRQEVNTRIENL
jgi:hypothetical protein